MSQSVNMELSCSFLFAFLTLCTLFTKASCAKILALPYNSRSHYFAMKFIAEELAQRGHEVILVAFEEREMGRGETEKLKIRACAGVQDIGLHEDLSRRLVVNKTGIIETMNRVTELNTRMCECLLNDTALINEFKTCDVMINDLSLICASVLRDLLEIPRVTFCSGLVPPMIHSWLFGIPLPLSYIPHILSGYPPNMTFLQRVGNVVQFAMLSPFYKYMVSGVGNSIKRRYNIKPEQEYWESESGDSELLLIQTDFAINYARPLPPAAKVIGPISPRPAKPLPGDLDEFMTSADGVGVIVVSFGSEAEASLMGEDFVNKLLTTFAKLKQKVLWKIEGLQKQPLPSNIKVMKWLPQNDVLGHVQTKLFVSHLGHNGMFEAAYHAVPMVGAPLAWEQGDNARMMETAGLGVMVDIRAITSEELYHTIQRVMTDISFRKSAARVSRLLKDRRRTPTQEAADHMEYVLRHGGARHLRTAALDIPWYQYFLIDVIAFIVTIVTLTVVMVIYLVKCVCSVCRGARRAFKLKRS